MTLAGPLDQLRARANAVPAPAMIMAAIFSVQLGAAMAAGLIGEIGALPTVAIRLAAAASVLVVVVRPSLRGRSGRDWAVMGALALALAGMNITFYQAIARLPLGVVTTIEFLGPLGLAAAGSRRPKDLVAVVIAFVGVVAVSGALTTPLAGLDLVGIAFAVVAGGAWTAYIVGSRAVGQRWQQLDGLAVAMAIAAVIAVPPGALAAASVNVTPVHLAAGILIGVLSSVVPYSLELIALRRIGTRVFGILMSLEPAVSALAGLVVLGQALTGFEVAGMALVVIASGVVLVDQRTTPVEEAAEIG